MGVQPPQVYSQRVYSLYSPYFDPLVLDVRWSLLNIGCSSYTYGNWTVMYIDLKVELKGLDDDYVLTKTR